ncbi:MAG: alpha-glucosidase/alpha-galactosidase [Turicibacter sp.]|nr:alpha-glucosidase/alpha-galactosidase [Turicibacter sp.]
MKYQNDKVTDMNITYIGGGSREWARFFMGDLALDDQISGRVTLYDLDYEAAKQNATIGNNISDGKWEYVAVQTLEAALAGADFIAISIQPGTFEEMASDVHLPERHGIYQAVGDTAGPGGIIRSLRTVPMMVEFAEAIKKYAPDAWVINYTNPMSLCMKTLYHVFPEIKAFGCCHEIFGTQEVLKVIAEKELGLKAIKRQDIKVNVLGVNHFTWLDYATYKGIDLIPVYRDFIAKHFEEGLATEKNHRASVFDCLHRVKFDLFQKYGYIAAAGDRHLAEFLPVDEYLKDPDHVKSWGFELTPVSWRKSELLEKEARTERLARGEEAYEVTHSGEEGVLLIKALCGLGQVISNVNIPNTAGQISNLPLNAIVETNALFERDIIRPVAAGAMPENILALTIPHVDNHDRILEAALTCNKELVVEAFMNDPLIKGKASVEEVRVLVADMIRNTLTYLPADWKEQVTC